MVDVPPALLDRVRAICLGLPETYEEPAWVGVRWRVRQRTFAHLFTVDDDSTTSLKDAFEPGRETTAVTFRVPGDELQALRQMGDPFFYVGWGRDVMAVRLDEASDWDEVRELLTDSYCVLAPHKLVARVDVPPGRDG